jgi:sugar/nucleoside kinase (ribokinase family)
MHNVYLIGPIYNHLIESIENIYESYIGGNIGNISIILSNYNNKNIKNIYCISKLSNDNEGNILKNMLKEHNINTNYIQEETTNSLFTSLIHSNIDIKNNNDTLNNDKVYNSISIITNLSNNNDISNILYISFETFNNNINIVNSIIKLINNNNITVIFDITNISKYLIHNIKQDIIDNILIYINIFIGNIEDFNILFNNKINNIIDVIEFIYPKLLFMIIKDANNYQFISKKKIYKINHTIDYIKNKWNNNIFISSIIIYYIQYLFNINNYDINIINNLFNFCNEYILYSYNNLLINNSYLK